MKKINIQDMMKELFGNSCLSYTYAYLGEVKRNIEPDIHTLTNDVLNGWNNSWIDDDGFVSKPVQYLKSVGITIRDIRKPKITKLSELPEGLWAVEYKKKPEDKASHFVVADRKHIVFDPSGDSVTCKVGQPVSYREFII